MYLLHLPLSRQPCGKCIPKPHNYKCDADYCTRIIKKKYKGGYKGDLVEDDLYKDVYDLDGHMEQQKQAEYEKQQQQQESQYEEQDDEEQQYEEDPGYDEQQQQPDGYENGQYAEQEGQVPAVGAKKTMPEFVQRPVKQPIAQKQLPKQQQLQPVKQPDMQQLQKPHDRHHERHEHHDRAEKQLPEKLQKQEKPEKQQQKQGKQAAQAQPKLGFKWPSLPFPKLG